MRLAVVNISGGTFSGGYRKYLLKLIPLFLEKKEIRSLKVYVPQGTQMDVDSSLIHYYKASRFQLGHPSIKKDLDLFNPDLIFVPSQRRFQYRDVPVINMVRNMEPLLVPFGDNPISEKLINIVRAWEAKRSTVSADRTIAVSKHVKDFITDQWKVSSNNVGVVYHGVNPITDIKKEPEKHHNIPDETPFLFTAGSLRPARGLEDAISALPEILKENKSLKLVVAGKADPGMQFYLDKITLLAKELGVYEHIIWTGHLSAHQMAWCFQNCKVFIMTSRAEACPNTVLEALTYGAPSVSTDTEPMPEFFQNNAIYYHEGNSTSLAKGVIDMLSMSASDVKKLQRSAEERASYFTWQRCADNTVAELKKVLQ